MDPAGLRPLGIGEIIDVAIKVYRARFGVLVRAVAVVLAPVFALSALIRISFPAGEDLFEETQPGATPEFDIDELWPFLAGTLLIIVLAYLASQIATGACFKAVSGAYLDEEAGWQESLRFARSKLGSLLWLSFLTACASSRGCCSACVPGVYLWVAWTVAAPVLLLEDVRGWKAMKRSRQLVKGRFWPTFGVVLLVAILTGIVQAVFVGILAGVVSVSGNEVALAIADAIGQTASGVLTTPLSAAVLTVLYFDLRVRKEGFDLELLSRRMGVDPATVANPAFLPPARRRRPTAAVARAAGLVAAAGLAPAGCVTGGGRWPAPSWPPSSSASARSLRPRPRASPGPRCRSWRSGRPATLGPWPSSAPCGRSTVDRSTWGGRWPAPRGRDWLPGSRPCPPWPAGAPAAPAIRPARRPRRCSTGAGSSRPGSPGPSPVSCAHSAVGWSRWGSRSVGSGGGWSTRWPAGSSSWGWSSPSPG